MLNTCVTSVVLVFSLVFATVTSGRFIADTDNRDKRQIGDLRTAEYLALITLAQMHRLPSHCADIACGMVDIIARLIKRVMSDQRIAELQAKMALSKSRHTMIAHGQFDPWRIGRRKKRSIGSIFNDDLNDEQKYRLLDIIMSRDQDLLS